MKVHGKLLEKQITTEIVTVIQMNINYSPLFLNILAQCPKGIIYEEIGFAI